MSSLFKPQDYLMNCLVLLFLLGFISFGAIGGCDDSGGNGQTDTPRPAPADPDPSLQVTMATTHACFDVAPGGDCPHTPQNACSPGHLIGGGCDCEYFDGTTGNTLGPAPQTLSIPARCQGDLRFGGFCASWECNCHNGTDAVMSIRTTVYFVCFGDG